MEVIEKSYVVRLSRRGFATFVWPGPGYEVSYEGAAKFSERSGARELLKECRKKGLDGYIAVMEIRIKNSMR